MFTSRIDKIMKLAVPNTENTDDDNIPDPGLFTSKSLSCSPSLGLLELLEENVDLPVCNLEDIIQDEPAAVYTIISECPGSSSLPMEIATEPTVSQPTVSSAEIDTVSQPTNSSSTSDASDTRILVPDNVSDTDLIDVIDGLDRSDTELIEVIDASDMDLISMIDVSDTKNNECVKDPDNIGDTDLNDVTDESNTNYNDNECVKDPDYISDTDLNDMSIDVSDTDNNEYAIDPDNDETSNEDDPIEHEIGKLKRTRRKIASKKDWHDNIQMKLREQGKKYIGWSRPKNKKGKRGPERDCRKMGPACESNFCKKSKYRKCQSISQEARGIIFKQFWETMSWDQKKIYVVSMIKKVSSKKSTTGTQDSRRKYTQEYNLKSTDGNIYPVCKKMFLNTLGMREWTVSHWVDSSDEVGMTSSKENAFINRPPRKASMKEGKALLLQFLENLPKLPSHYCRQSSQKTYIEPIFGNTMADVYKAYVSFCSESGDVQPVSRFSFDKATIEKNFAIQLPKKDRCDLCCMYDVKAVDEATYNEHTQKKIEARTEKENDKKNGEEGKCTVITQDVQAVKVCPSLNASALYFKTKLCNHNFTIYDINRKRACCYWFTEADADLTSNTFTSCIIDYLKGVDTSKPIIIWSDGCTYQNRNSILANALLVFSVQNKVEIFQKYLEKGHTQMEADSVHAAIERKLRNKPIYLPSDFLRYTVEATKEEKYDVKQLSFDFVKDYLAKSNIMYESIRPGRKSGDPTVTDIKVIKYSPEGKIQVKIDSFSSDFFDLPQRKRMQSLTKLEDFKTLRNTPIKISNRKWIDLQGLKNVIPLDCHSFYDNLDHED